MAAAAAAVLLVACLRARRDRAAWVQSALVLAFAGFGAARGAESLGWAWGPAGVAAGLTLLGALAPIAASALTGRAVVSGRNPAVWIGPALLGIGFAVGGPSHPWVRALAILWALAGGAAATVVLALRSRSGDADSPDATRLGYLAAAHAAAVGAAGVDLVAAAMSGPRIATLLAPLVYLYAAHLHLARVRVADLRLLIGRSIALSLLAAGLAGSFAVLWLWVGPRLDVFLFNAFATSFALLLLLEPSRRRIQALLDRRFLADRLQLERTLLPLRERLAKVFTLDECLAEVLDAVERTGRLRASALFLRDDPLVGFQQVGSIGLPPRRRVNLIREPAWVAALERGQPLLADEIEAALGAARRDDERTHLGALNRLMRQLDAQLALPLRAGSHLLGFWTLCDTRAVEPFSSTDLDLLESVADGLAVAIENSQTFERVRARDQLARLGEMAAGLAHELRNPLAAIRGAAAVLDSSENDEFQRVIVEEVARLDRVVGTFLDYARPSATPAAISDPGRFVREAAERAVRSHADGEVELEILCAAAPPALANADQLERVIANVVENALQALEGKGRIEIAVRAAEDPELGACVEIDVSDDGPGMDEETLERALQPFFTTRAGGTGLGLALCERLVRAQGGSLELRSRPGDGTGVRIHLPRARAEPEAGA